MGTAVMSAPVARNGSVVPGQGMKAELSVVTPARATVWLESMGSNRPVAQAHVDRLAQAMRDGEWRATGEAIKFDTEGNLVDGQHRLWAVVASGVTIPSMVVTGVARDAFDVMDTGRVRRGSDVLAMHEFANASSMAAIARHMVIWEREGRHPSLVSGGRYKAISNPAIHEYAAAHYDELDTALRRVRALRQIGGPPGGYALWGGLAVQFARLDDADADDFLAHLATGESLTVGHPILMLRNRLSANLAARAQLPPVEIAALAIRAWNAYRAGVAKLGSLRWIRGGANPEPFPEPR